MFPTVYILEKINGERSSAYLYSLTAESNPSRVSEAWGEKDQRHARMRGSWGYMRKTKELEMWRCGDMGIASGVNSSRTDVLDTTRPLRAWCGSSPDDLLVRCSPVLQHNRGSGERVGLIDPAKRGSVPPSTFFWRLVMPGVTAEPSKGRGCIFPTAEGGGLMV